MECIYCNHQISDRANFCPHCKKQIKCLKCFEVLEKECEICIICGENLKENSSGQNTIEFNQTKKSQNFKAHFSNEVGHSIGEALGIILRNKDIGLNKTKKIPSPIPMAGDSKNDLHDTVDADFTEIPINQKKTENEKVFNIFNDAEGNFTLLETRLKASSKRDYGIRLAIIYLYYKLLKGIGKVDRNHLNAIMRDANLYDGNFRRWLANNHLIGLHDDLVELKAPGREIAKQYISDIYDDVKTDIWKLGSAPRKKKKKDIEEDEHE